MHDAHNELHVPFKDWGLLNFGKNLVQNIGGFSSILSIEIFPHSHHILVNDLK